MRKIFYFLITALIGGCVLAQTPNNVKKAFNEKYPNAIDVSWGIDRNSLREAHFKIDGIKYRADFTLSGKWVETETNVGWDDLPKAVKVAFEKEDKKKDIIEIELVDHHEKGTFYDIEYKTGGGKIDIAIRPNGSIIGKDGH